LPSRLVVFGVAAWVTVAGLPTAAPDVVTSLEHPFTGWPGENLLDLIFSPLAKWDSLHYLSIAYDGYVGGHSGLTDPAMRPAFFPLYPGIVRVLSGFAASPGLLLIVAYAVSLACFFAALVLLHRLTTIEIGERYARPTLLLLCFFPTSFFFGIPYSESLFLLLAVAAFLAARTGRWAIAGAVLALASATRAPGLLLIVPVALLYLYGPRADREPATAGGLLPRYPIRRNLAWLSLAPLGFLAYCVYLHYAVGDALAWSHAQSLFGRHTVDPLTGMWAGVREAGKAIWHVGHGTYRGTYDYLNIGQLAFVAFAVVGGIGALRVLPPAYGVWVLVSLVPIFMAEHPSFPYYSSMRFVAVLFPLFLWLAIHCERRGATTTVVAVFAAGMAVLAAQFTLWSFVA
jgi:hypothetical protein